MKICGVRTVADAEMCVELGAASIGLNFVASSPRCIAPEEAVRISRAIHARGAKVIVVGVVANMDTSSMQRLVEMAELDCLQLHGDEPPEVLLPLLPHAYKAVRIATAEDVTRAQAFAGDYLLADAKVEGALGGTGTAFDWTLVRELATLRRLTLAGGLHPANVADAVRAVRPYCVDVASGVESAPGVKDRAKVRAFIDAARLA